jgi:hypothetical protein
MEMKMQLPGRMKKSKRRYWTEGEMVSMRELYPFLPTFVVARQLRRTESSVNGKALEMGLKKHPSYYVKYGGGRLSGYDWRNCRTCFTPGHTPWNKGKKGWQAGGKSVETRFKKGQLPVQTLYDGAIRVRTDNRGVPVKFIRIAQAKWEYLSRYTWQQHNGPIPPGYNIVHRDGDSMNCNIENLECISRAENMRRNSIQRYPEEVKSAIKLIRKLEKTINHAEEHNG